jgi:hypothetical protein
MNKYRSNLTNNIDKNFVEQLIRSNVLLKEHSDKQIEEKRSLRKKVLYLENQMSLKDKTIEQKQNEMKDLEFKFLQLQSKFDSKENSSPKSKNYVIDETVIDETEIMEMPKYPDFTDSIFKTPEVEINKKRKIPFTTTFTKQTESKQMRLSDLIKPMDTGDIQELDEVEVVKPVGAVKTKNAPVVYKHVYDGLGGHKKVLNSFTDAQVNAKTNKNMSKFKVTKSPFSKR